MILDCNIATEILSGFKKQDLVGNNFLKVSGIPDKYIPFILEDYDTILKGENPARREIQLYTKEGDLSWVLYQVSIVKLNDEQLILLIIQDIREQKKFEQKLKESEKKYRLLVENAQEGIWAIDIEAYTTFVNKRMAEILGYTEEEMIGKHLFDFIDESEIENADSMLERRRQGLREHHDFEFLRKDGTKVYASLETSPILDDNGAYIGAIACIADITERKQIKLELEKYRKQLEGIVQEQKIEKEEVEKQLSNEINDHKQTYSELTQILNSSVPICVIDKNYEIMLINDTYAHFFHKSKEKVIGKKCFEIMNYNNCHTPRCTLKQILNGALLVEYEKRKILNDGGEIFYLVRATPYKDSDSNVIGVIETYIDITQRINIEKAVIESEEKYRLITETAHDLIRVVNER